MFSLILFCSNSSSSSGANLVINGLTSSSNINNNINCNKSDNALSQQLGAEHAAKQSASQGQMQTQSQHLAMPMRTAYGLEGVAMSATTQLMSGSEIQLQNENQNQSHNQNHYNSSNNPISMPPIIEQMMQMQMQQQQSPFPQHQHAQMINNRQSHLHPHPHQQSQPPHLAPSGVGSNACPQLNSSLELDDNELSGEEEDDELDNEMDELDAAKQQLIDGGSSSSTSLQAPPSQLGGSQTPGSKKDKPSYNCLLCPKSYRKRKSLLDHYKLHPGYCHDCGQPNGNTLEVRTRTIHML